MNCLGTDWVRPCKWHKIRLYSKNIFVEQPSQTDIEAFRAAVSLRFVDQGALDTIDTQIVKEVEDEDSET